MDVGLSTIGEIILGSKKWLRVFYKQTHRLQPDRAHHPKHQNMEDSVYLWLQEMTSRNAAVNDMLMMKMFGRQIFVTLYIFFLFFILK